MVLALSLGIPYEVIENHPQFIWQLFGELPPAGVVAALLPSVCGLLVIAAMALTLILEYISSRSVQIELRCGR